MTAVRRDAAASSAAILDAAEESFGRVGYELTTFSTICRTAGVSRGLPSYLFGNKAALYRAVVERAAERLRTSTIQPLRVQRERLSIEEALTLFVDTYFDYLARNPNLVRLLQWEMLGAGTAGRPFAPTSQLFGEIFEIFEGIVKRRASPVEPSELIANAVALCFFPFMLRVKGLGIESIDKATLRRHKRRIASLLVAGIGAA